MKNHYTSGFTVAEMITVIGILTIFASVTALGVSQYRAKARDHARQVDIDGLAVTMRLYVEQYGADIDCEGGLKIDGSQTVTVLSVGTNPTCNDGQQILDFIASEGGRIPADPQGPGNADYYYYYDNRHNCDSAGGASAMLFAANLEQQESNVTTVCGVQSGSDGGYERTTDFGGTIEVSQPYVRLVTRSSQI